MVEAEWASHVDVVFLVISHLPVGDLRHAAQASRKFAEAASEAGLWRRTIPTWWRCSLQRQLRSDDLQAWRRHALLRQLAHASAREVLTPCQPGWTAFFEAERRSDVRIDMALSRALHSAREAQPEPHWCTMCRYNLARCVWRRDHRARAAFYFGAACTSEAASAAAAVAVAASGSKSGAGLDYETDEAEICAGYGLFLLSSPATAAEGRAQLQRALAKEPTLGQLFYEVGEEQAQRLDFVLARRQQEHLLSHRQQKLQRAVQTSDVTADHAGAMDNAAAADAAARMVKASCTPDSDGGWARDWAWSLADVPAAAAPASAPASAKQRLSAVMQPAPERPPWCQLPAVLGGGLGGGEGEEWVFAAVGDSIDDASYSLWEAFAIAAALYVHVPQSNPPEGQSLSCQGSKLSDCV